MSSYGPEHRALFESRAAPLYEAAVAEGGLGVDDARVAEGAETHAAFDLLLELGLLHLDPEGATYLPEDPSTVQSRVVSPLSQNGSRLLEESSQWARAFGGPGPDLATGAAERARRPVHLPARRRDQQLPRRAWSPRSRRRC